MKHLRIGRNICLALVNNVFAGTHFFNTKRLLLRAAGVDLAENVRVVGPIFTTAKLVIGEGAWIGRNLTIHGNGVVKIGRKCDIAPDVTLLTGTHKIGSRIRRAGRGQTDNVSIGDGCWIGARVTILPGVEVGDGAVVSACACVTKNVPDDMLVGGVPAKAIKEL